MKTVRIGNKRKGLKFYIAQSQNPPEEFIYSLQFNDSRNSKYLGL